MKRWLLIEDPGPWGYDALAHNRVPADLFRELKAWADSVSARVVLIRRGARLVGSPRKLFIVDSRPDAGWVAATTTDDISAVTSVDRSQFKAGDVPGTRMEGLFLVCTHGRHDRCCSVRGNPVARALCARYRDTAWECSHIGGDRFAANLVCLPRGAYFGRVSSAEAEELTADYARGELKLDSFRGWSFYPFAVQAAEIAVRRHFELSSIDDVEVQWWTKHDDKVEVKIRTKDHGELEVVVSSTPSDDEFYLTCRAQVRSRPPVFEAAF